MITFNSSGNHNNQSSLELRRLQLDELTAQREFQLRSRELEIKAEEVKKNRWSNPLLLGIIGAIIAASGNLYGTWLNTDNQITVESNKISSQRDSEKRKAEADRISEAIKLPSTAESAERLSFLIKVGLVTDPNTQAALQYYLNEKLVGKVPSQKSEPSSDGGQAGAPRDMPDANKAPIVENYESGWLGGGNNQSDQCAIGRTAVVGRNPGKSVLLKSSSEKSRKDFLGRVEYRYFCVFEVR